MTWKSGCRAIFLSSLMLWFVFVFELNSNKNPNDHFFFFFFKQTKLILATWIFDGVAKKQKQTWDFQSITLGWFFVFGGIFDFTITHDFIFSRVENKSAGTLFRNWWNKPWVHHQTHGAGNFFSFSFLLRKSPPTGYTPSQSKEPGRVIWTWPRG